MRPKSLILSIAVLYLATGFLATRLAAQNPPEPSIADAARRYREQKKSSPKTAPVITDDTFSRSSSSKLPSTPPAGGTPPATQTQGNATQPPAVTESSSSSASATPEISKEDAEKLKSEIAAIKQELKDKQGEVELLQRLLNLDRDAFLSKPDYSRDTSGKAKLDAEQDELKQKSEEFERLKAKLQSIAPELVTTPAPAKP